MASLSHSCPHAKKLPSPLVVPPQSPQIKRKEKKRNRKMVRLLKPDL